LLIGRSRGNASPSISTVVPEEAMFGRFVLSMVFTAVVATTAVAQEKDLVFAITEGVTYEATPKDVRDRFALIAEIIGRMTGRRVTIVVVPSYDDARAGLLKQEYDIAFVHPAHVAMAEIKAGRYRAVAWTSGFTEYTVSLMMNAGEPLKSLDDLKGRTIVTPDPDSITAAMVRAMFRAEKLPLTTGKESTPGAVRVITTGYQDAVPFYVENNFAQVGASAANSVVKAWTDKGGQVLARSRPVPIKQFIASSKMPTDEQARIRETLLNLRDSRVGREALAIVGYKGFVAPNPELESATIAWLGL
jgi:ABC-type phosphate/phosphonate transport system substrate-binding protein